MREKGGRRMGTAAGAAEIANGRGAQRGSGAHRTGRGRVSTAPRGGQERRRQCTSDEMAI